MKLANFVLFTLLLLLLSGCGSQSGSNEPVARNTSAQQDVNLPAARNSLDKPELAQNQASLHAAEQSQSIAEAMDRKIIRNAELSLEVAEPDAAQRKVSAIAESLGGFVVTSESKQRQTAEGKLELEVNLVVRVPASKFGPALEQIRAAGNRTVQEKITGEDVTEEFIDLEARLKTQIALEQQFLEIMKQAHKVEDALEVQRQIAEVRTEIEKIEGRKRFLENRASLSTITINLSAPAAIAVNTSGFRRDVREAISDSIGLAVGIVLFLIRFVILMVPVFLLILLPVYFIGRFFYRRSLKARFMRKPVVVQPPVPESPEPK